MEIIKKVQAWIFAFGIVDKHVRSTNANCVHCIILLMHDNS